MNEHREIYSSESIQKTRVKLNRKTVGITLPQPLIKQARKHQLNISRITEQALNSILDYLEAQNKTESSKFLSKGSFLKESFVPRWPSQVGHRLGKAPFDEKSVDWVSFREFLKVSCIDRVAKDRVRYAKKYCHCLLKGDLSELNTFSDSKRNHIMKGLSALAKFLGIYEDFKGLIKAYGLKWKSCNADDLIISRLTKAADTQDVIKWIRKVRSKLLRFGVFLDFTLASGLRYEESVKAYNLIVDLAKEGRLNSYYNAKTEALEHFRFKKLFIRRTKKAFVSFVPKQLVKRVSKQKKISCTQINKQIQRNGFKLRFSDIREYYATYMNKWLTQSEIDFLQGRVSASVFMRNYFNPALIGDLKTRVFKGIANLKVL